MPSFKKESFGKLADGRDVSVWTLRNTKGNELKVTDFGARLVSMRFRGNDFKNRFVLKTFADAQSCDSAAGAVLVDGATDFANVIWNAEQLIEGLKLSATLGDKTVSVVYSLSNDNEISIKYTATGAADVSTQVVFDAAALPDVDIRACQTGAAWEKISDEKTFPVTQPAEVEMELGMFGYDPGCPIDYLDAGLKNAANLFSAAAGIDIIVYATQDEIHAQPVDGGVALKTGGAANGQTVYMLKNRK